MRLLGAVPSAYSFAMVVGSREEPKGCGGRGEVFRIGIHCGSPPLGCLPGTEQPPRWRLSLASGAVGCNSLLHLPSSTTYLPVFCLGILGFVVYTYCCLIFADYRGINALFCYQKIQDAKSSIKMGFKRPRVRISTLGPIKPKEHLLFRFYYFQRSSRFEPSECKCPVDTCPMRARPHRLYNVPSLDTWTGCREV